MAIGTVSNTTVQGNTIGLNAAGTGCVGNAEPASMCGGGTLIGGDTALKRNIISGNTQQGISSAAPTGTTVSGNWIGVSGRMARPPSATPPRRLRPPPMC